ncbi:MAG TPA: RpiB/LacA/LacB family sugar-phosphate isomerase [Anaerolineales bacterium]|jgi:ribose 5-phosphate isomerase B|nr:RpiB/LacA/LacB family sugar-phosphate isomerase [Anaerolineales bacterium]
MKIGFATDHGGYILKEPMLKAVRDSGHTVMDFGAYSLNPDDDYPDFVIPLASAVAHGEVERGIAICGSGVGASFTANKVPGVRSALIHESFSAHQGVEDDDMNLLCLGGRVIGFALAWEIVQIYLAAHHVKAERFERRLAKVAAVECKE